MTKLERWCNKCNDYVMPKWVEWESSIAVIHDLECPKCREIFDRRVIKREAVYDSV